MLKYWNETLEKLSNEQLRETFRFNIQGTRYEVPLSFALAFSDVVSKQYIHNPTIRELSFTLNDAKKQFKHLIKGKLVDSDFFLEAGKSLENNKMIEIWKEQTELSNENVIQRMNKLRGIPDQPLKEEIDYVVEHLEEMEEQLNTFTNEELIEVLHNPNLQVESEETVWEIIKNRMGDAEKEVKRQLLECVNIDYLKANSFQELIEEMEEEDFWDEKGIWDNIKARILTLISTDSPVEPNRFGLIHYQRDQPFEGVFDHLSRICDGNVHEKGMIEITGSSSVRNSPERLVDHDFDNWWYTENEESSWVKFDLKDRQIQMTGYILKSYAGPVDGFHMKNWVVEGSNDEKYWAEIDEEVENADLNGESYTHYYPICKKTEFFKYIRLRMTGPNHNGSNYLFLTGMEIFGLLVSAPSS